MASGTAKIVEEMQTANAASIAASKAASEVDRIDQPQQINQQ